MEGIRWKVEDRISESSAFSLNFVAYTVNRRPFA